MQRHFIMVKSLCFGLLGLFAVIGSAASSWSKVYSLQQKGFSHSRVHPLTPPAVGDDNDDDKDTGIIYLPPSKRRTDADLNAMMQEVIDNEMTFNYDSDVFYAGLVKTICNNPSQEYRITNCNITILSQPSIKVIPSRPISRNIICTSSMCNIQGYRTIGVPTTHSSEASFPIKAGGESFYRGVKFTGSFGYEFSETYETSAWVDYSYYLDKGDQGYVAMVNAQISAKIRVTGCKRLHKEIRDGLDDLLCTRPVDQTGHNEVIIVQEHINPRGIIAFIHL